MSKFRSKKIIGALILFTLFLAFVACNQQKAAVEETGIRSMVLGVNREVKLADGSYVRAINFDNAATTPAFISVMEEVNRQLELYGSIGRGKGQKSQHSTEIYEKGRLAILNFVGADPEKYTAFYVNNTTDGLNKLASAIITSENDIILTTRMEHHANDLPWRRRGRTIYADVDSLGRLRMDEIERLLQENDVKIVTITAASNLTGYVNDVHAVAELARKHGAKIVVDGAQIVAHRKFNMQTGNPLQDIDFFVFSAHKMYAPFGGGAVVGLREVLDKHIPKFYGGGSVGIVSDYEETYLSAPELYESGSPNYPGVVAMIRAIEILDSVGFDYIVEHEQVLMRRTIDGLKKINGVKLYGDVENISDKVGIVIFSIDGMTHSDVAERLANNYGISVRQGAFCSHPYAFRLLGIPDEEVVKMMRSETYEMPGMVRVSFGIYNDEAEVDVFLKAVKEIAAGRN